MTDYLSNRGQPTLEATNRYHRLIGTQTYNEGREACNEMPWVDLTDRDSPYAATWEGIAYDGAAGVRLATPAERELAATKWRREMERIQEAWRAGRSVPLRRAKPRRETGERTVFWEADADWPRRWQIRWDEKRRGLRARVKHTYEDMAGGDIRRELRGMNARRALESYDPRVVVWAAKRDEEWTLVEGYWRAYGFWYKGGGVWRVIGGDYGDA